jgi:hypothetical protein
MPAYVLRMAQQKGMKVVLTDLLGGQVARSATRVSLQRLVMRAMVKTLPESLTEGFNWKSYCVADACVALRLWEAHLLSCLFRTSRQQIHVIPNGVENIFLQSQPVPRGRWLVCTAAIVGYKRLLETARAAIKAQTPFLVIGKPYEKADPYFLRFVELAKSCPQ